MSDFLAGWISGILCDGMVWGHATGLQVSDANGTIQLTNQKNVYLNIRVIRIIPFLRRNVISKGLSLDESHLRLRYQLKDRNSTASRP